MHRRIPAFTLFAWASVLAVSAVAQEASLPAAPGFPLSLGNLVRIGGLAVVVSCVILLLCGRSLGLTGGFKEAVLACVAMFVLQVAAFFGVAAVGPGLGPVYGSMLALLSLFIPGAVGIKVVYKVHFLNGLFAYFLCLAATGAVFYGLSKFVH